MSPRAGKAHDVFLLQSAHQYHYLQYGAIAPSTAIASQARITVDAPDSRWSLANCGRVVAAEHGMYTQTRGHQTLCSPTLLNNTQTLPTTLLTPRSLSALPETHSTTYDYSIATPKYRWHIGTRVQY
jgi:hypothetical protein